MLDKESLKVQRDEDFYKWFEKWWMEQDFENYILRANKDGNTSIYYYPRLDGHKILKRFKHRDFLKCCQEKLPEIDIYFINKRVSYFPPDYEKTLVFDWSMDEKDCDDKKPRVE